MTGYCYKHNSNYRITFKFGPISFLKKKTCWKSSWLLWNLVQGSIGSLRIDFKSPIYSEDNVCRLSKVTCLIFSRPLPTSRDVENPLSWSKQGYNWALNRVMCSKLQTENLAWTNLSDTFSLLLWYSQGTAGEAVTDKHWQSYHLAEINRNAEYMHIFGFPIIYSEENSYLLHVC